MNYKVLIIHNTVAPYRLPIFEKLSEKFDLEVIFCAKKVRWRKWKAKPNDYTFRYKILKHVKIGPLVINYTLFRDLIKKKYDVYIICDTPEYLISNFITFFVAKMFRKPIVIWTEFFQSDFPIYTYKMKFHSNIIESIIRFFFDFYRKIVNLCY